MKIVEIEKTRFKTYRKNDWVNYFILSYGLQPKFFAFMLSRIFRVIQGGTPVIYNDNGVYFADFLVVNNEPSFKTMTYPNWFYNAIENS